jgi:hypothetical protein
MATFWSWRPQRLRRQVLDHQQLEPVQQLGGRGLLLQLVHAATWKKTFSASRASPGGCREVRLDDALHRLAVGEADVVEEAAAQEGVRQLLLVVGGDDDDGAVLRLHRPPRLVDEELHPVEFEQQVVRELDVRLVDLVDQQHHRLRRLEGLPQLAADDVVADVVDPLVAELPVAQARHRVVLVEALLRLGGGLDVPLDQRVARAPAPPPAPARSCRCRARPSPAAAVAAPRRRSPPPPGRATLCRSRCP